ncbi:stage III sporulation protein AF [Paenibacillus cellulosilyticus]|uniref:Stage III sporulation protein AF n=1 Tax=Paenibacillus cellulosilyticus TaxID=375489 RepID=A0A2V2Z5B1_9BACL|nr:stage III sporulation protein AF [Paenibacillus cellulosilyticus]PWW05659.1 stage III sporulation protein AF [Paenibacillus cellulosilyticus]QKS45316.1 stage III sporulation protein AF [Paenibacillus cellulosilyticus]
MMDWLSGWLRDIITVILLAAIVDLLLPNKAMQRYARLVVGLIVLLTILSPLIRLFAGNFNERVEDSMTAWEQAGSINSVQMPTLQQISKEAQRLSSERQRQAASLAERELGIAMAQEVDSRLGSTGTAVMVKLSEDGKSIASVLITIPPPEEQQADDQTDEAADNSVQPIDIAVSVTVDEVTSASSGDRGEEKDEEPTVVTAEQQSVIEQALRQGWGIAPKQIQIRTK